MATVISSAEELFAEARELDAAGDWDDALRLYREVLADNTRPDLRATVLRKIGRLHFERGDHDAATQSFEASLVSAQAANQRDAAAAALNAMAACAQLRGNLDVAERLYEQAGVVAEEIGDIRLSALVDQNLGTLANTRGDLAGALVRYQSALERFRRLGDERAAAWVLNNMGMLHVDVGEWGSAELSFQAAYQLAERRGDPATLGKVDSNRAELYLKRQNFERARECCDQAFRTFGRIGSESGLGEVHKFYGILYHETGKPKVARIQLSLALKLARACDDPLLEAETESERARVFVSDRQPRLALQSLNRAFQLFSQLDARREILDMKRRLGRMENTYFNAAEIWLDETDTHRVQNTAQRGRRVADYAQLLASEIGFEDLVWLRIGAFLKDVGNAAVPTEILQKPSTLTASEWELVAAHPAIGDKALQELSFPAGVRSMVRNHHEHWDGSGYPDRLCGEEIPLPARVIAVADVFDALTTDRSDRPAYAPAHALDIMTAESGRTLDPKLLSKFRKLLQSGTTADLSALPRGASAV